jgi:hypothetical protein
MEHKTMEDVVEKALRDNGGEYLWAKLNPGSTTPPANGGGLFGDPHLLIEVQRFMEANRLPIATSISRYALQRALIRLRALLNGNSNGEAPHL